MAFPDGGLAGWGNVIGGFVLAFSSFGQANIFGVFQTYYSTQLLPTYSAFALSWIGSTQIATIYTVSNLCSRVFDVHGARTLLVAGCVLSTFCLIMTSLAKTYVEVLLAQGIGLGIGMALQFYPIATVPTHWFNRRRTIAIGIVFSGSSLAGVVYSIMLPRLFDSIGFPWAVRVMAFLNLGLQLLAIPLVKERLPRHGGLPLVDFDALRDVTFLLHLASGFLASFALYTPFLYMEPFALTIGLGSSLSFYTIAVLNAAGFAGRLVTGYAADKVTATARGRIHVPLA